ncbi:hypothetical protein SynA1560_01740 [Synechococcus sp. A15-60]|nr:hypothetical protein SynA1560_01740 [Synechococcus sp. A15-60]
MAFIFQGVNHNLKPFSARLLQHADEESKFIFCERSIQKSEQH